MDKVGEKFWRRIYLAPEQLKSKEFRKLWIDPTWTRDILAIIVDEVHVVVDWGEAFRPIYTTISDLRHMGTHPIPLLAVSATLSRKAYDTIARNLQLSKPAIINIGSRRPNIYLEFSPFKWPMNSFRDVLEALPEMGKLKRGGESGW
jgi:superfamily II DNA helicase RecQ